MDQRFVALCRSIMMTRMQVVVEWKAEFPNAASRRASVPHRRTFPRSQKRPRFPVKELTALTYRLVRRLLLIPTHACELRRATFFWLCVLVHHQPYKQVYLLGRKYNKPELVPKLDKPQNFFFESSAALVHHAWQAAQAQDASLQVLY